ncbi:hypothetical protein SIM91_44075 [Rhodococcus opacus]|uniref:hypothetical protein n=1 Tax=Rhodococcus opacus TaxID=37919 RepID=UPI0007CD92E9|nr:hypothetical protein [Rhodococcus opacus]MDX5970124.1 hypothetical protein [Rhodococcus opacus]NKY75204.1 hypothetical protein [Rhodococcus opacus]CAG7633497.1 hypothetical protein E143388_07507 [Rhodococcus opacus]
MNDDQRRALERVRDTCTMLHSFLTTHPSDRPPERVRSDTFAQLTDDLFDAVTAAQTAGIPEHRIFDSM